MTYSPAVTRVQQVREAAKMSHDEPHSTLATEETPCFAKS